MAVLTATNGNVQLAAGAAVDIPAGPFTIAILFRRSGTTTDGFEALLALVSGGSVVTNVGTDATTSPYAISFGQGGFTRTFTGLDDLVDGEEYLLVILKDDGEVAPEANLYRFDAGVPAWHGWVTASGTVENRADVIDAIWLMNQPGGFPLNGGEFVAGIWDGALAKTSITHASTGLHIGVQQWLDLNPVVLVRPGETDPVQDESAAGTSDETSSTGVTIAADDPTGFNMDFGGAAPEPGPVWSPHTLTPPGAVSPAGRRTAWLGAGIADQPQVAAGAATVTAVGTASAATVKVVAVSGRMVAAAAIRAIALKVAPATGVAAAVASGTATTRKVTPASVTTTGAATTMAAAAKRIPVSTTAVAAATAVVSFGPPVVPVSARCSAIGTMLVSAAKRLPAAGAAVAVATTGGSTIRSQPVAATTTAALTARAATSRMTALAARVVAVAGVAAQSGRRTSVEGRCVAVAAAVVQASQPGQSRPVVARLIGLARIRVRSHQVIPRPNTGTVARPNTGIIVRPNTGIIERP